MKSTSQFKEREITTCCALRFDGYKYEQETAFNQDLQQFEIKPATRMVKL